MKGLTRLLIGLSVLLIAALAVYWFFPGLRHRGRELYRKYGGWTEEARRGDPVGFIDYAEQTLNEHLNEMQSTQGRINDALLVIDERIDETTGKMGAAEDLAETFRMHYRQAKQTGEFPITVAGKTYTQEEAVRQVRLILRQHRNYRELLEEFRAAAELARTRSEELVTQIADTKASLAMLPAKREIARLNKLSGATEELMTQVNELIMTNAQILHEKVSPIRTVEELLENEQTQTPERDPEIDANAFLEEES
ncbi:MAG: hypothetical protein K9N51_00090 [Candidatus Pacebacteria bacterium]|nr:hypothetical protein [Candidatus Paceibacterota bacterium]